MREKSWMFSVLAHMIMKIDRTCRLFGRIVTICGRLELMYYRNICRKGIASALTSNLAVEIIERGKVPFYCCAWSNIRSAKNAIRSGFMPAWVEMTVKPASMVAEMNQ